MPVLFPEDLKRYSDRQLKKYFKGAKKVFNLTDIRFYMCPLKYFTRDSSKLIDILNVSSFFKIPYYSKPLSELPAYLIQALTIYREVENKFNSTEVKK